VRDECVSPAERSCKEYITSIYIIYTSFYFVIRQQIGTNTKIIIKKIMVVMHVKFDKHLTLLRLHFTLYILSLIGKLTK